MSKTLRLAQGDADAIQAYIYRIRDLMGLSHWDVFLAKEPAPKGAHAAVEPCEGRLVASLHLAQGWMDRADDDKRNDIVHELLHVLHRDQTDTIRCGLLRSGYLPDKASAMLWAQFHAHTEVMVDHLASVIAPTMPPFEGVAPPATP